MEPFLRFSWVFRVIHGIEDYLGSWEGENSRAGSVACRAQSVGDLASLAS